MSSFSVPGAVLDTELSDEGGHPVVQLHGLTSSRSRDRVMNLDLGRGLSGTRLLRYDARAHGRSTGRAVPEEYRWTVLAEDLLRLLDARFPGERVHGVGPSMGSATLLHAAIREPERFSGFTLMVPPTAWETRPAMAEQYLKAAAIIERRGLAGMLSAAGDVPSPPAVVPVPDSAPDVAVDLLPSVYRGAALSDLPPAEDIARIQVPTSILAWVDDPAHPLSTAETLVGLLPAATLRVAYSPTDVDAWPGVLRDDVATHG